MEIHHCKTLAGTGAAGFWCYDATATPAQTGMTDNRQMAHKCADDVDWMKREVDETMNTGQQTGALPDDGFNEVHPVIFWFCRIALTLWIVVAITFGAVGVAWASFLYMVPIAAILYQGFNGFPRPFELEANARIFFYSLVGLFIVYFPFFLIGRLFYWIVV
jgi:hypothetical protein